MFTVAGADSGSQPIFRKMVISRRTQSAKAPEQGAARVAAPHRVRRQRNRGKHRSLGLHLININKVVDAAQAQNVKSPQYEISLTLQRSLWTSAKPSFGLPGFHA